MTNDNELPDARARGLKAHNDLVDRILEISTGIPPQIVSAALLDCLSHSYVTAVQADVGQLAQLKRLGDETLDAFMAVAVTAYQLTGKAR